MSGLGGFFIILGAWLIFSGYNGLNPLTTIQEIIKNPSNAQNIIRGNKRPLGAGGSSQSSTGGTKGAGAVAYARAQVGKTYWDPMVMGCSGLVTKAYKTQGVTLPNNAALLIAVGQKIGLKTDLAIGDLVYPSVPGAVIAGHVQIYSGNGNIIEATRPGEPVRERPMWGFPGANVRATRPVG